MSEVVTGEAVALDLRLAKLPSRLVAAALDFLLQLGMMYAAITIGVMVLGLVGLANDKNNVGLAAALLILALVIVLVGYPVVIETLTRGQTLGKMAMGIRVVRDDGGPIGFRQALVRGLFAGLVEKPGLLFGFTAPIGIVTMLISEKAKRLGDLTAGTVVLQERVPAPRTTYAAEMPPPLAGWAATLELTRLDDGLALSVRQFLARLDTLDPRAREALGGQLCTAVAAVATPPPPPGTPGWAYLTAVLAERRRRDRIRLGGPVTLGDQRPGGHRQGEQRPGQPTLGSTSWATPRPAEPQPTPDPQSGWRDEPAPGQLTRPGPFAPPG